jgi:hypothetical protein
VQWEDPRFVIDIVKEDYEVAIHHTKVAK